MEHQWTNGVYNENYSAMSGDNISLDASEGYPFIGTNVLMLDIQINSTDPSLNSSLGSGSCSIVSSGTPEGLRHFRIVIDVFVVGFLCIIGFVGNAISIVVLQKDRDKKNTTNWLLQTLAVADTLYLIASLFLPTLKTIQKDTTWWPELRQAFPYLEPYIWPFASITQTVTVWLVMLVTIDRHIAVCMPLKTHLRTPQRTKLAVVVVVIGAILYNVPRFLEREIIMKFDPCTNKTIVASQRTPLRNNKVYFLVYKTIMYFIFRTAGPLITLIVLNIRLIKALQEVRRKHRNMTKSTRNRENITLMLVVVVSVFILCEIPDLVLRFMFTLMSFVKAIKFDIVQLRYFNTVTNALLTLNSAINFLIYCLIGNKFRTILRNMCCGSQPIVNEASEQEPLTTKPTRVSADVNNGILKDGSYTSKEADVEL